MENKCEICDPKSFDDQESLSMLSLHHSLLLLSLCTMMASCKSTDRVLKVLELLRQSLQADRALLSSTCLLLWVFEFESKLLQFNADHKQ